jgi:hypothetical protein
LGNGKKIYSRCAGILIKNWSRYLQYASVPCLTAKSLRWGDKLSQEIVPKDQK